MASTKNETARNAGTGSERKETAVTGNAGAKEANVSADAGSGADKTTGALGQRERTMGCSAAVAPVYAAAEFCSHAQELFGVRPECVKAALLEHGTAQCTKAEAQRIVDAFLHKEVK